MISNYEIENFRFLSGKENLSDIFNMELNTFESVSAAPKVTGCISLYDLLTKIRYNFLDDISVTDFITPKYIESDENSPSKKMLNPAYDEIKGNKKTVCYNATFNRYKAIANLISATNLMFLDIDGFESKEETLLYKEMIVKKYDWIVSCNLSFSRIGLHVIILVDKIIDNDDFNNKYDLISALYFDDRLDDNAKSLTRHAIIPSDINIYINDNPKTLKINSIIEQFNNCGSTKYDNQVSISSSNNKKGTRSVHKEGVRIRSACTFSQNKGIKEITNNAARVDGLCFEDCFDESEFTDPNIPIYLPDGIDVMVLNLYPYRYVKVNVGNRNRRIGGISMRLIYLSTNHLNDEPDRRIKAMLLKYMLRLNKEICDPPLDDKEVVNSVNSNWNKYVAGELDVSRFLTKKRSFWSKQSTIRANDKRIITCNLKNEPIVQESNRKITDAIKMINDRREKITQNKVAEVAKMHKQTVKKYWKEYKPMVKDLNSKLNLH